MSDSQIKLESIHDKNINFLFGAGASAAALPTLAVKLKKSDGTFHTIETLSSEINKVDKNIITNFKALLFMHYYNSCIKPMMELDPNSLTENQLKTVHQYNDFLKIVTKILSKKETSHRPVCNYFTTNYDSFIEISADRILTERKQNLVINDGTRGFFKNHLDVKNFNIHHRQSGTFSNNPHSIPQINLIHLHGSCYWKKNFERIEVEYKKPDISLRIDEETLEYFSMIINDPTKTFEDLTKYVSKIDPSFNQTASKFLDSYNSLPIVNPTQWKFHETVFEEHYYEMLRFLSYELEKPDTVLIAFGFSFADQHILKLIQRSLFNPKLQLFICCYSQQDLIDIEDKFQGYKNVTLISSAKEVQDFNHFNNETLSVS